jgi:two-component system LytT family response regulator
MIFDTQKTALIVDDAPQARTLLRLMLAEYPADIQIVDEASNLNEAITQIAKYKPAIVFLDVEMPDAFGTEIFDYLPTTFHPFEIIFTTAYEEYALQAIKIDACDYLLKPLQADELAKAISKAQAKLLLKYHSEKYQNFVRNFQHLNEQRITLPGLRENTFIKLSDILFLEAEGSYTHFHMMDTKPKLVSKNLKEFEDELLATNLFYRPHRSYLVNTKKITGYLKQPSLQILLESGQKIPVARQKKAEFMQLFGE